MKTSKKLFQTLVNEAAACKRCPAMCGRKAEQLRDYAVVKACHGLNGLKTDSDPILSVSNL